MQPTSLLKFAYQASFLNTVRPVLDCAQDVQIAADIYVAVCCSSDTSLTGQSALQGHSTTRNCL